MDVNLTDWLGTHLVLLWLSIAVLLAALELIRRDRSMLGCAAGALVAAGVALVLPHSWWAQLLVGALVAVAGVVALSRRRAP